MVKCIKRIICIVCLISALFICPACDSSEPEISPQGTKMYPVGFEDGICDGVGNVVWGMSFEDVLNLDYAKENNPNQIVFEGIEFAGCNGEVICKFENETLNSIVYSFEGDTPYEDYEKIMVELTNAYGESLTMASLSEAESQNSYRVMNMWKENVVSTDGNRIVVLAEMKPPEGWITVNLIRQS